MNSPGSMAGARAYRRRRGIQFGLLRTLVWISPGFIAAVAAVLLVVKFPEVAGWLDSLGGLSWLVAVPMYLVVTIPFGILDAVLNPSLPLEDGKIRPHALRKACLLFVIGQILVLPLVCSGCAALVDMSGFRI